MCITCTRHSLIQRIVLCLRGIMPSATHGEIIVPTTLENWIVARKLRPAVLRADFPERWIVAVARKREAERNLIWPPIEQLHHRRADDGNRPVAVSRALKDKARVCGRRQRR